MTRRSAYSPLFLTLLAFTYGLIGVLLVESLLDGNLAGIVLMTCILGLVASFTVPTYYRLEEKALRVRCGVFTWIVPYNRILRITPTRSLLASPAWSGERVEISYRRPDNRTAQVLISPVELRQFAQTLASRSALSASDGGWD